MLFKLLLVYFYFKLEIFICIEGLVFHQNINIVKIEILFINKNK